MVGFLAHMVESAALLLVVVGLARSVEVDGRGTTLLGALTRASGACG
jgi:hypothetical protein